MGVPRIPTLELDLYVAGEPVSVSGFRYITDLGKYGENEECTVSIHSRESAAMEWRVQFQQFIPLLDNDSDQRPGWCGVTVGIFNSYGSLVCPFRPQLLYGRPWWHPSLMVWPDSYVGPVVLACRVPAQPGRKCNAIWGQNATYRCVLDEWHPDVAHEYQIDPRVSLKGR